MDGFNFFNGQGNTFQGLGLGPSGGGRPFGGFDTKLRSGSATDPYQQWIGGHDLSKLPAFGGGKTPMSNGQILGDILKSLMGAIQDPSFLNQLQELQTFIGGAR